MVIDHGIDLVMMDMVDRVTVTDDPGGVAADGDDPGGVVMAVIIDPGGVVLVDGADQCTDGIEAIDGDGGITGVTGGITNIGSHIIHGRMPGMVSISR